MILQKTLPLVASGAGLPLWENDGAPNKNPLALGDGNPAAATLAAPQDRFPPSRAQGHLAMKQIQDVSRDIRNDRAGVTTL